MNITFDGSPSLVAHITDYDEGLGDNTLTVNLGSVIGEFPSYSWGFVRDVIRKALADFLGRPKSEMVQYHAETNVKAILRVLREVPYYHTDEGIPPLDRVKMGVLLPVLANKNCECEGSGFSINVTAVVPCDCVDKTLLLHYYEKRWGKI